MTPEARMTARQAVGSERSGKLATEETHEEEVRVRPFRPEDQQAVYDMWWDGWEDTIRSQAQAVWGRLQARVLKACAAFACAALAVAVALHLTLLHVPVWVWCLVPAVWSLYGATFCAPAGARRACARKRFYGFVSKHFVDMFDIQAHWVQRAGREYWVAVQGGQVVGGAALSLGRAARQQPPCPAQPAGSAHASANVDLDRSRSNGDADNQSTSTANPDGPSSDPACRARPVHPAGAAPAASHAAAAAAAEEDANGFGAFEQRTYGDLLRPSDAILYRMVVDKTCRGRGVGRLLVRRVMRAAAARGAARMVLSTVNPGALAFYGRVGFEDLKTFPGGAVMCRTLEQL